MKLLRLPELLQRVGASRSQLYLMMDRGDFPKPVKISERMNGWVEIEINTWLAERIAEREREAA